MGLAKVILYFLMVMVLIQVGFYVFTITKKSESERDDLSLMLLILHSILALSAALNLLIAKKSPQFVQYIGVFLNVGLLLSIFLINTSLLFKITMTSQMRTQQFYLTSLYFLALSSLINVRYLRDLVLRLTCFTLVLVIHFMGRTKEEMQSPGSAAGASFVFVLIVECISYLNSKGKAKLFLRMACTKIQEKQLFNLLDTVPDKVLICSPRRPDSRHTLIYANRQMTQFYGGSIDAPEGEDPRKS